MHCAELLLGWRIEKRFNGFQTRLESRWQILVGVQGQNAALSLDYCIARMHQASGQYSIIIRLSL